MSIADDLSHGGVNAPESETCWVCAPGKLLACATSLGPTSTSSRSASAATSSAGRPTRRSRSPCSTPTRAAGGNFVDTADAYPHGCPATAAASPRRSSAAGWPSAATATRSCSRRRWASKHDRKGPDGRERPRRGRGIAAPPADRPHRPLYAHRDDEATPPEETLAELDALVREGNVRHVAASNSRPSASRRPCRPASARGWLRYVALQPHYNLVERGYEHGLADVCRRYDLGCLPYYAWPRAS